MIRKEEIESQEEAQQEIDHGIEQASDEQFQKLVSLFDSSSALNLYASPELRNSPVGRVLNNVSPVPFTNAAAGDQFSMRVINALQKKSLFSDSPSKSLASSVTPESKSAPKN